ncbi:MAG: hypothetical protein [Arizlama microvirus]|nr:MAG: hypothetical protein [Arizlama microvirus]
MKRRFKMKDRKSKRLFSKTADKTHMFNKGKPGLKRGGIRL